jgi:hypothetical protein
MAMGIRIGMITSTRLGMVMTTERLNTIARITMTWTLIERLTTISDRVLYLSKST